MGVNAGDSAAGKLGQLHGTGLGFVQRASRAISGEYRRMALFDCLGERHQTAPSVARTGSSRCQKAEPFNGPRNQLAVEAEADQYGRLNFTRPNIGVTVKITSARNKATVPETPHLQCRRPGGLDARLKHNFVAQGAMEQPQQKGHQRRNNANGKPLTITVVGVFHRAILQAGERPPVLL